MYFGGLIFVNEYRVGKGCGISIFGWWEKGVGFCWGLGMGRFWGENGGFGGGFEAV